MSRKGRGAAKPVETKPEPTPANRRVAQKAATRAKILAAARVLFAEKGYHAATVRDIAAKAGVSAGSLFTTFNGKAQLLQEIVNARLAGLLSEARQGLMRGEPCLTVLSEMGRRAYAYEARELRLLAESIGASWTWDADTEAHNRKALGPLLCMIVTVLETGQERGEIAPDADTTLLSHTVFSCYLQNFRLAIFDAWSPERLAALLSSQIRLVLAGARA